jgi:hypothetical protein
MAFARWRTEFLSLMDGFDNREGVSDDRLILGFNLPRGAIRFDRMRHRVCEIRIFPKRCFQKGRQ